VLTLGISKPGSCTLLASVFCGFILFGSSSAAFGPPPELPVNTTVDHALHIYSNYTVSRLEAPPNPCDLNHDGVVNVIDVQLGIEQVLGITACGSADLNGDGVCNVIDIQEIINASFGMACLTLTPPVSVTLAPASVTLTQSQAQTFSATVTNTGNTAVTWSLSPLIGSITAAGLYTAPASISSFQTVTVTATSVADSTKSATATVALNPPVHVTVAPASVTLTQSQTQSFSATVTNTGNTAVTWSLSPAAGSISAAGVYTAPASIPTSQTVTVTAASVADPTKSATATVTLNPPLSVTVAPPSVTLTQSQTQTFSATVTNTGNTAVTWSLSPLVGSITAAGLYTAPASIASSQTVTVTVTSAADPTKSATVTVTLNPPVNVTVAPASVTLTPSQTQSFSATVTNTGNTAVTWSLSPLVGSITAAGLYTAPASIASSQTVTVTATSVADPTKSATATVTLSPFVGVTVAPASVTLTQSQTQSFSATVTNTGNTAVTWSLSPMVGSITAAGLYTAPASIASSQTVTVTATSVADPTKSAIATVTLNPPVSVTVAPASVTLTQSQTQSFSATVVNTSNTAVRWSLSPSAGTISAAGLYTAPASIASSQTVTVTATSVADSSKSATTTVTLNPPVTVSLTPSSVSLQPSQNQTFTTTVSGTSNTGVTWSFSPALGGLVSGAMTAVYVAPSTAPTTQTVTITATSMADPSKAATAVITVLQAITVSLSPSTVSLLPSDTQQFTATVSGASNAALTWSINPSVGTISSAGLYTAPSSVLTSQTVTVTAQSVADPTKSASAAVSLQTTPLPSQWSIGYYSAADMPVAAIQWSGLTHIIHLELYVDSDGTLATSVMSPDATALIAAAHTNRVKALICLEANGPQTVFNQAIEDNLSVLVSNIMTVVNTYGYDGVDIDWEPVSTGGFDNDATSAADMKTFAQALRTALGSKLLTVAAMGADPVYWGSSANASFDRIDVMTYDLCDTEGSFPWYNSALFGSGKTALDYFKAEFLTAGVPAAKLNLGLAFFGIQDNGGVLASDPTQGISGPMQVWETGNAPTGTYVNYNAILQLITLQDYNWDPVAVVPYLSYPGTPSTSWYLTYDNPQSIQAKVQYIIAQNLGGWIIWRLGTDYVAGNPHPHPLLDAVQAGRAPTAAFQN